jgi:predicted glycosyltransferase
MHLIRALAEEQPASALLLVTGSPAVQVFGSPPANADFVKIPTIAKTGTKRYQPPHLPIPVAEVSLLRERLIRETIVSFEPDVFLVDNFPLGSGRELLPTLMDLKRTSARTVLGLRDVLDAPDVVRRDWDRQGIYEILDRFYDRILVYGMRDILDAPAAYDMPAPLATKVRYCGYVTDVTTTPRSPAEVRAELEISGPFLLATGGGGGDGYPLLRAFAQALEKIPRIPAVVVTGPLMSEHQRCQLREMMNGRGDVRVIDAVPDLRDYIAASDLVVSMCGYNTAAEILSLGARAIVIPRTWRYGEHAKGTAAGTEGEQRIRAEAMERLGLADYLPPENVTPGNLAERIRRALESGEKRSSGSVSINGLRNVTGQLLELARSEGRYNHAA